MSEAPPAACVLCAKPVPDAEAAVVNGKRTCLPCRDAVLAELARESQGGRLGPAVAAGVGAAVACGALWAVLIVATGSEIGFAAVGIGWAVAHAIKRASGGRRGLKLQRAAVASSALGLLLGKYFFVAHDIRVMLAARPVNPVELSYFDPKMLKFFVMILPRMLTFYDALWLFLALSAAWRILRPARVVLSDARRDAAPAA
jgi:hypothetical protein